MKIKGQEMKAVVRQKRNYGCRSAYTTEYEDREGNRHITATIITNRTGEKSLKWYLGVGIEGLKRLNKICIMEDEEFNRTENSEIYGFYGSIGDFTAQALNVEEEMEREREANR